MPKCHSRRRRTADWDKVRSDGYKHLTTYIPIPTTTYVAYQKLTSPPNLPFSGGYHGIARRYKLMRIVKTTATSQALNSPLGRLFLRRRYRTSKMPAAIEKSKKACGYDLKSTAGVVSKNSLYDACKLTKVEGIASRRSNDHDKSHQPLDEIGSKWCTERFG